MPNNRNALILAPDPDKAKADSLPGTGEGASSEPDAGTPRRQTQGPLPHALQIFSQKDTKELVSAVCLSLKYLPTDHHGIASSLFRSLRQLITSREEPATWRDNLGAAVESFEIQLENSERPKEYRPQSPVDKDAWLETETETDRENFRDKIWVEDDQEVDLLLRSRGDINGAVRRFIHEFNKELLNPTEIFLWLLPLIEQLDNKRRDECIDLLGRIDIQRIQIMLLAS